MDKVIKNGPWGIDNSLICLVKWERQIWAKDNIFNQVKFWVQITRLPRECYTKEVRRKLANLFCKVEEIHIRECTKEDGQKIFRFWVSVDISKLLRWAVKVKASIHGQITGLVRNKRLPYMCFQYGCIGHTTKQCLTGDQNLSEETKQRLQYGTWLQRLARKQL